MNLIETAIAAVVSGGKVLSEYEDKVLEAKPKESIRDVVTEADIAAEKAVLSTISKFYPSDTVLSEESGDIGEKKDEYWIVDALDGTVNFLNGIPTYCVSVAYWKGNGPVVGAIYNPVAEDLYYAELGNGAYLNHKKLGVVDRGLADCVTATAFSGKAYCQKDRELEFKAFGELNDTSQGSLRTGSASMNLGYVAEGKIGLAVGKANKLWDVAAGILIAQEASASVEFQIIGDSGHLVTYVIGTESAHQQYRERIGLMHLGLTSDQSKMTR